MASQYKNLFFDLDDTLWAFSLNARDTFEEMYHKYDYDRFFRSFQHFYTLYQHRNVELWEEYGRGQVSKEELNRQRFLYPLEAVGAGDAALAEAFSDDFFSDVDAYFSSNTRLLAVRAVAKKYVDLDFSKCEWDKENNIQIGRASCRERV